MLAPEAKATMHRATARTLDFMAQNVLLALKANTTVQKQHDVERRLHRCASLSKKIYLKFYH
jgi:hypothetical protein